VTLRGIFSLSFLGFGDLFFIFLIDDKAIESPSYAAKEIPASPGRGIKSFISLKKGRQASRY